MKKAGSLDRDSAGKPVSAEAHGGAVDNDFG